MATTIKDLAKASGVSPATVSYVLNNGPRPVHSQTRERVLEAMRRLNYHPSAVARGLSKKRLDTVGVVMGYWATPDIDPYVGSILGGILTVAQRRRQSTTLFMEHSWTDVLNNVPLYCDGRCDGLLLIAPPIETPVFAALKQKQIPFVLISDLTEDPDISGVDVDNRTAAYRMVCYLIGQGHRRIALLRGDDNLTSAAQRLQGYCDALEEAGIPYDEALVLPGGYNQDRGHERALELMRLPESRRPTALFCSNDNIAFGALNALKELGLQVPRDISVAGFDDVFMAALMHPPLTTVHHPLRRIGERAAEILLSQIHDGAPQAQKEVIPAELTLRDSVAAPNLDRP
ncbi:MAG TPA: LacI family DNA-binding transcriptional regulator [Chthonomonadaceae bacterium]|nr:LacI family DNA-binding transcriptional regulator [Chthonomonadaceae bacterium]